ncbi:hypothetical protein BRADI_2g55525v3 [Brachypodium distachyon]|uniref:SPARK domain-containing protein n=1 Tax=Brachypodium distachyon TaxID=15368 RepID=A0A2K2DG07_BRADI|nr:hypothetical protein BRADI_2g55525v3 [Brachypodium distachyon]
MCRRTAPPAARRSLLPVFAIGLAARLRSTGRFRLPSAAASFACIRAFSDALASPPSASCFPDLAQFAISPSFCAGVTMAAEYATAVGDASVVANLNSSCGVDLAATSLRAGCLDATVRALASSCPVPRAPPRQASSPSPWRRASTASSPPQSRSAASPPLRRTRPAPWR